MATGTNQNQNQNEPVKFVHTLSAATRLLPSSSQWNSIEIDFGLVPGSNSTAGYVSLPSQYSKAVDYEVVVTDRKCFKRCLSVTVFIVFVVIAISLLVRFLPHKNSRNGTEMNLTLAINQALTFFDAQKSGNYPVNSSVKFRGNSGLKDGSSIPGGLVGGFYDSGNNIKFSFTTAYAVTLLSWTVIEYHDKYKDISELDHAQDIIRWGTDYLLQVFDPTKNSSDSFTLYSQVGSGRNDTKENDIHCWERPEDMDYDRAVSSCDGSASDVAGEIIAALSAASIVFSGNSEYSKKLVEAAENLYNVAIREVPDHDKRTYTELESCGGDARQFYNSSGYEDELVWGGTWLFFATGNRTYLDYATRNFTYVEGRELVSERGVFYWNNKLTASAVLLTRLRFFRDLSYPYEDALRSSQAKAEHTLCSYLNKESFTKTPGGLMLLRPEYDQPLELAMTASFLSKLYSDYLQLLRKNGIQCGKDGFSIRMMRSFSTSQVHYILGKNPMKMSYMVGFGNRYPTQIHHRAASIPWNKQHYGCQGGKQWLESKDANPNIIYGAMVPGPDKTDHFTDDRTLPKFTQPSIASNAGLVAAVIAIHDQPGASSDLNGLNMGIDLNSMFDRIHVDGASP